MSEKSAKRLPISLAAVAVIIALFAANLLGQTAGSESASADGTTQVYIIREGDNLWDISGRFLESPFAWPRLWEENEFITNPHLIFPGEPLLMPGGVRPTAPVVARAATPAAPPPPPPEATELTGMFETERSTEGIISPGMSVVPDVNVREGSYYYSTSYRTGFISDTELRGLGAIVESPLRKKLLTESDKIYLNLGADSGIQVGDKLTIFRTEEEVEHPETGEEIGYKVKIVGSCVIDKIHEDVSTAHVYMAYDMVLRGDRVRPFQPSVKEIVLERPAPGIKGYVVASREPTMYLSQAMVVYVDLGTNAGVSEGNTFAIVEPGKIIDDNEDFSDNELKLPDEFIGFMVIVAASEKTSAGLITSSLKEVKVGMEIISVSE